MLGMIYETSKLHHLEGITYRDHPLTTLIKELPKGKGGSQPTPEGCLWLLLTGDFPTKGEHEAFRKGLFERGKLSPDTEKLIQKFPKNMHPMTQFSMGILAC